MPNDRDQNPGKRITQILTGSPLNSTLLSGPKISAQELDELACPECGSVGRHSSWCQSAEREEGGCPTCGSGPLHPGWFRQELDVSAPNFGEIVPCPECYVSKTARLRKIKGQLEGTLVSKTFKNYVGLDGSRDALIEARAFVDEPRGWLTLYGEHGPGKTHLCAAIVNALGSERAVYFNTPDLVNWLRADFSGAETLIRDIERAEVLVLDELDKVLIKKNWTREQLQRIFDDRYRNSDRKGLVIATNNSPRDWDDEMLFVASRMQDENFRLVELKGDSRPLIKRIIGVAG